MLKGLVARKVDTVNGFGVKVKRSGFVSLQDSQWLLKFGLRDNFIGTLVMMNGRERSLETIYKLIDAGIYEPNEVIKLSISCYCYDVMKGLLSRYSRVLPNDAYMNYLSQNSIESEASRIIMKACPKNNDDPIFQETRRHIMLIQVRESGDPLNYFPPPQVKDRRPQKHQTRRGLPMKMKYQKLQR